MDNQKKCIAGVLLILVGCLASSFASAFDEVVDVEIFNGTTSVIVPGSDFTWTQDPDNAGHDFAIGPSENQELMYYLPQSRAELESFSYLQGNRKCHFSFGHVPDASASDGQTMPYRRWAKAEPAGYCLAELLDVEDNDEYVRHGGTRIKFSMN